MKRVTEKIYVWPGGRKVRVHAVDRQAMVFYVYGPRDVVAWPVSFEATRRELPRSGPGGWG